MEGQPTAPRATYWTPRRIRWVLAGALLVALATFVTVRISGPAPASTEAPETAFSAERAKRHLTYLSQRRPPGSREHERTREALVGVLTDMGLSPEVQTDFLCGGWGTCAVVRNVVARVSSGAVPRRAVMLTAHYDSVAAAPGVSDDGAGVAAVVETLRALQAGGAERFEHDLVVLFTDGEEIGLLGAKAFWRRHRWATDVAFVINLEARGTRGPSMLFETGPDAAWTIAQYGAAAPRPATNSAYQAVYEALPNSTDFAVYRGVDGANFGYIGNVQAYHTPQDDLAALDMRSLQHHGDNALALALAALQAPELPHGQRTRAPIYTDVAQLWLLSVPRAAAGWLVALALAALLLGGAWVAWRRGRWQPMLVALAGWGVGLFLLAAIGYVLDLVVQGLSGNPAPWWNASDAVVTMHWVVAAASVVGLAAVIRRACGPFGTWWGFWMLAAVFAAAAVLWAPAFSWLWLWPAVAAAVVVFPAGAGPDEDAPVPALAWAVPSAVLLTLWLPTAAAVVDAVGTIFGVVVIGPAAFCLGAVVVGGRGLPVTWRSGLVAVVVVAASVAVAVFAAGQVRDNAKPPVMLVGLKDDDPATEGGIYAVTPPMTAAGESIPLAAPLADALREPKPLPAGLVPGWLHVVGVKRVNVREQGRPLTRVRRDFNDRIVTVRGYAGHGSFQLVTRGTRIRSVTELATGQTRIITSQRHLGLRGIGPEGVQIRLAAAEGATLLVYAVYHEIRDDALEALRDRVGTPMSVGDVTLTGATIRLD